MENEPRYRHELKYSVSYADFVALRGKLRMIMQTDPHTNASGRYCIRSIYFDNYSDKALREKVDGIPQREKFRIRYYNDDTSRLTLEKKIKHNGLCMKCSEALRSDDCRKLLSGEYGGISTAAAPGAPFKDEHAAAASQGSCELRAGAVHLRAWKRPGHFRHEYPDVNVQPGFP